VNSVTHHVDHQHHRQALQGHRLPQRQVRAGQRGHLKGKWSVVFFYPADFTFVCPTELGDLADHYDTFKALGVEIYGVSTDTHFTHKAWHDTSDTIGKIRYPMIGDPTGTITRNFGVMIEEEGLALRGTFVINPEGQIKLCEVHDNGIGRDARNCCARCRRPSTWPATRAKSARPSGRPVPRRWRRRSTWSARSDPLNPPAGRPQARRTTERQEPRC
jgi:peroxiredoxin